jgi:hypothetical protein
MKKLFFIIASLFPVNVLAQAPQYDLIDIGQRVERIEKFTKLQGGFIAIAFVFIIVLFLFRYKSTK